MAFSANHIYFQFQVSFLIPISSFLGCLLYFIHQEHLSKLNGVRPSNLGRELFPFPFQAFQDHPMPSTSMLHAVSFTQSGPSDQHAFAYFHPPSHCIKVFTYHFFSISSISTYLQYRPFVT